MFEVVPRGMDGEVGDAAHAELDLLGRLAAVAGTRLTFSVVQTHTELDRWRLILDRCGELARRRSADLPTGRQPRHRHPVRAPEPEQRVLHPAQLSRPRRPPARGAPGPHARARGAGAHPGRAQRRVGPPPGVVRVRDVLEHAPGPRTARLGTDPGRHDGRGRGTRGPSRAGGRLRLPGRRATAATWCCSRSPTTSTSASTTCTTCSTHPASVWGLGDGGAHCGAAVDASGPTLMLTHWVRDRTRGPRVDLPPRCGG